MSVTKYSKTSKIVLIHGFGTSVQEELVKVASKGKKVVENKYRDFDIFHSMIKEGNAYVFKWNEHLNAKQLKEFTTIKTYIDLYNREKRKAVSRELQTSLSAFLKEKKPEMIVCHSMGCYLLLKFLERNELPDSVKKIFFVQGDFDKKYQITNKNIIRRIEKNNLRIINLYCPWDTTLLLSPFVNKMIIPAGLTKTHNPYIVDILFPLGNNINLHVSSLKSTDLLELISKY